MAHGGSWGASGGLGCLGTLCLWFAWGSKEVPPRSSWTPHPGPLPSDVLETLSDIDEMSRRRPEVLGFFSVSSSRDLEGGTHPAAVRTRHCPKLKQEARQAVPRPQWHLGNRPCSCHQAESPWLPGDTPLPPEQTNLQRLMSSAEESCRNLAFNLALRSIQNNPR